VNASVVSAALLLALLAGGAWMAFGKKGPALHQNAGVMTEGFGTSVRLGMKLEEAQKARPPKESVIDLMYLSTEELANHDLYTEHPLDRDLIAVISSDFGAGPAVQGLRAYLGKVEAEGKRATLNGQFAANLSVEEVKQMYGKPFSETPEQNGRTHLVYYFADPASPRLSYRLTTSHDYTGRIFSMALEQVLAPQ
jgi:hypothetical protein